MSTIKLALFRPEFKGSKMKIKDRKELIENGKPTGKYQYFKKSLTIKDKSHAEHMTKQKYKEVEGEMVPLGKPILIKEKIVPLIFCDPEYAMENCKFLKPVR